MIYARINGKYNVHASGVNEDTILDEVAVLIQLVIQDLSTSLDEDVESITKKAINLIQEGYQEKFC